MFKHEPFFIVGGGGGGGGGGSLFVVLYSKRRKIVVRGLWEEVHCTSCVGWHTCVRMDSMYTTYENLSALHM